MLRGLLRMPSGLRVGKQRPAALTLIVRTVNVEDVLLCARRNPSLEDALKRFMSREGIEQKKKTKPRKRKTADKTDGGASEDSKEAPEKKSKLNPAAEPEEPFDFTTDSNAGASKPVK